MVDLGDVLKAIKEQAIATYDYRLERNINNQSRLNAALLLTNQLFKTMDLPSMSNIDFYHLLRANGLVFTINNRISYLDYFLGEKEDELGEVTMQGATKPLVLADVKPDNYTILSFAVYSESKSFSTTVPLTDCVLIDKSAVRLELKQIKELFGGYNRNDNFKLEYLAHFLSENGTDNELVNQMIEHLTKIELPSKARWFSNKSKESIDLYISLLVQHGNEYSFARLLDNADCEFDLACETLERMTQKHNVRLNEYIPVEQLRSLLQ